MTLFFAVLLSGNPYANGEEDSGAPEYWLKLSEEAARSMESEEDRAYAFATLALRDHEMKKWGRAAILLDEAGKLADRIETWSKPDGRDRLYGFLCRVHAWTGNPDAASNLLTRITADSIRAYGLEEITLALGEKGRWKEATALCIRVEDPELRDSLLGRLAELEATRGDFEGAGALACRIRSNLACARAIARIAQARAKSGATAGARKGFAEALSTASDPVRSPGMIQSAEAEIASLQAECGLVDDAIATIETMDESKRGSAFVSILRVAAKAGGLDDAKKILGRIDKRPLDSAFYRQDILTSMAIAHIRVRDLAGAFELAQKVTWCIHAREIGEAFLEARAWEMAAALGNRIATNLNDPFRDEGWKLLALTRIGEGNLAAAKVAGDSFSGRGDYNSRLKDDAFRALVIAHAKAGDLAGAIRLVDGLGARDRCYLAQAVAWAIRK